MTGGVAERLIALGRSPLAPEVDDWSRAALLDTVSALVAGGSSEVAGAARRFGAHRSGAQWRAFSDATAASALDIDDGHDAAGGVHVGSTVVPVLLAIADDAVPLSALRGAMVVGYEVGLHAGLITSRSGGVYRASGYAAAIGAAAARVVLDGGTPQDLRAAVRVAQAHAPASALVSVGTRESIGWAAVVGVTAVELAREFDVESLDEGGPLPSGEHLLDHPGLRSHEQLSIGCYIKPYACCRAAHWALDAIERMGPVVSPVSAIVTVAAAAASLDERRPRSLGHAQFALPWLIARILLHGAEALLDLTERFDDPAVHELAERIDLRASSEWDDVPGFPARVDVRTADGASHVVEVVDAPGRGANLAVAESKARRLLAARADRIVRLISGEATVGELREAIHDERTS